MKKIAFSLLILGLSLLGCNKHKYYEGPNSLFENFENLKDVNNLYSGDNSNWSYYQQTLSNNYIDLDTANPHTGKSCLKIFAAKGIISKSDLAKNKMAFWEKQTIQLSAWYYLKGTDSLNFVFLMDLEEDAEIGASPGIRIAIDNNGYLLLERKKYGQTTIEQPTKTRIRFPRNQWVHINMEVKLEQSKNGYIKLWQDSTKIIDAQNILTLPKDKLYFIQGTKGMYQSVQIGVTASSSDKDIIMYIDDIAVQVIN